MAVGTVRVSGLAELNRAFRLADKELAKELRKELRAAGNIVRDESRARFSGVDAASAAGYRTVVRQRGVAVEQSLGRTTGLRADFGALQMRRAIEPALTTKQGEVIDQLDGMLDRIGRTAGF